MKSCLSILPSLISNTSLECQHCAHHIDHATTQQEQLIHMHLLHVNQFQKTRT
jgi:hypothetical protein